MTPKAGRTDIDSIVKILRKEVRTMEVPIVTEISRNRRDPFDVLISTVLSLRTKDEVTREASRRLLQRAGTPADLLNLSEDEIARLIFPGLLQDQGQAHPGNLPGPSRKIPRKGPR